MDPQRYRTIASLGAVRLRDEIDKPGVMATIPADSLLDLDSDSKLHPEMVNVLWGGVQYSVFRIDLDGKTIPFHGPEAEPKRRAANSGPVGA